MSPIPAYEHPDRLRAIVGTYFRFLEEDAGFTQAESRYQPAHLTGHLLLTRRDVVIRICLHNDDLDLYIAPTVPDATFVKVNLLLLYFKHAMVDYAALANRPQAPEPSQDEIWRDWAGEITSYLPRIIEFAQADRYDSRLAEQQRYETEVAAHLDSQRAMFGGT